LTSVRILRSSPHLRSPPLSPPQPHPVGPPLSGEGPRKTNRKTNLGTTELLLVGGGCLPYSQANGGDFLYHPHLCERGASENDSETRPRSILPATKEEPFAPPCPGRPETSRPFREGPEKTNLEPTNAFRADLSRNIPLSQRPRFRISARGVQAQKHLRVRRGAPRVKGGPRLFAHGLSAQSGRRPNDSHANFLTLSQ
jgi:hypothetical protein